MSSKPLIAVCQMCSTDDKKQNMKLSCELIESASRSGAQMIFLPEAFDFIAPNKEEAVKMAESVSGFCITNLKDLARRCKVWLSLGGFHERISDDYISNCHIIIDDKGEIVSKYDKLHLFDVDVPSRGLKLMESGYVKRGSYLTPPVSTPAGKLGLSICYDLRFPEMAQSHKSMGAEIISYPSAFSYPTGAHHWEVLLRARAIETQTYIVAAAQTGFHSKSRQSWGHAMIVDPFGSVIAQCSDGASFALAHVDLEMVKRLGSEMPVQNHKRYDIFPQPAHSNMTNNTNAQGDTFFSFGHAKIPYQIIFCQTMHSVAFTNLRCVVPGHVLVASMRSVPNLEDLSPTEASDLFCLVQRVDNVVRKLAQTSSSLVAIQNGEHSGQTVKHVHVHILPRRPKDFPHNDDVYSELDKHDKDGRPERTLEEMTNEANLLKKQFEI